MVVEILEYDAWGSVLEKYVGNVGGVLEKVGLERRIEDLINGQIKV